MEFSTVLLDQSQLGNSNFLAESTYLVKSTQYKKLLQMLCVSDIKNLANHMKKIN